MDFSRRQFLTFIGAASLAGCAKTKESLGAISRVDVIPGGGGKFTFAAINDLHILDGRSASIVNRAADSINANKDVAFTAVLGDLATDGEMVELNLAKNSLDRLVRPHFVIPGNHDVYMKSKDIFGNYKRAFDEPSWHTGDKGWLFIGLNSCDATKSDVSIRDEEMEWLQKVAKKANKSRPIAILSHHPFNPNSKAYRVQNADEVLGIFAEHNVKLVAAGHYHGNQEEEREGILFTTTACCSTTRDNHDGTAEKGYRLFHVDGETITTEFVVVQA
ncbi:MAG: hypothetical protein AMXMBFR84_03560 [Candidatus Hydrogenedentota bacterium]